MERFIQTFKKLMTHEFTVQNTRRWINLLPEVLKTYNNRFHKTIKMSPSEASQKKNAVEAYNHMYSEKKIHKIKKPKFAVVKAVRIGRIKATFEKRQYNLLMKYKVLDTDPITYKLKGYSEEVLQGSFYEHEMLKTETADYYEFI